MEKNCLECGAPVKGRSDKKFCDDTCRSMYNNKKNTESGAVVKQINAILKKNRSILSRFNPDGKAKVSLKTLMKHGFNPDYFTHLYITKENKQYYFCYDHGYFKMDNDYLFLVIQQPK